MRPSKWQRIGFRRPREERISIRDDNMRLIFADVICDAQTKQLHDIQTGFKILKVAGVIIVLMAAVLLVPGPPALAGTTGNAVRWDVIFSPPVVLMIVGAVAVLLTFIVLTVERRRTLRDIAEHQAFLKHYNRL